MLQHSVLLPIHFTSLICTLPSCVFYPNFSFNFYSLHHQEKHTCWKCTKNRYNASISMFCNFFSSLLFSTRAVWKVSDGNYFKDVWFLKEKRCCLPRENNNIRIPPHHKLIVRFVWKGTRNCCKFYKIHESGIWINFWVLNRDLFVPQNFEPMIHQHTYSYIVYFSIRSLTTMEYSKDYHFY